jgi:hypothetical protein
MILSTAARVTLAMAGVLAATGVATLARLRTLPPGSPAAYAARIAGTMLVMLGLILTVFTLTYASSAPLP